MTIIIYASLTKIMVELMRNSISNYHAHVHVHVVYLLDANWLEHDDVHVHV